MKKETVSNIEHTEHEVFVEPFDGAPVPHGASERAKRNDDKERADELLRGKVIQEITEVYRRSEKEDRQGTVAEKTVLKSSSKSVPHTEKPSLLKRIFGSNLFRRGSIAMKVITAPTISVAMSATSGVQPKPITVEDDFSKHNTVEVVHKSTKDSLSTEKPIDPKQYEKFGITVMKEVKTNDTTKNVYFISLDSYNSFGEAQKKIKDAGLELSSEETLDEAVDLNQELSKKARFLMSLKLTVDKLGKESYATVSYDEKKNTFRSNAFEVGKGFNSDFDNYMFVVEIPKKTVSYNSGIAKSK